MHRKLFSFHVVAFALSCCFHLVNGDTNSTASCSSSSMVCANLGNITYPFWGSANCSASTSYVLSNCTSSSTEVFWDSFSTAADGVIGPPVVTALDVVSFGDRYNQVTETSIQLSWNQSLTDLDYCAPLFSSKNLSFYNIPSSINLTRFSDSSALEFSSNNTYLLFNCTKYNASNIDAQLGSQNFQSESASGCMYYKGLCTSQAKTPCIQWSVPLSMKELMLQNVLDSLACSHFMFGFTSLNEWGKTLSIGSIALVWTDIQCQNCQKALGGCIYDVINPAKFNQCVSNHDCDGGLLRLCNTGKKVGFSILIIAVVLGIVILIRFRGRLGDLSGMIRESIRVGFVKLTQVTIPIVINVLKDAIRKLQSVSYGPGTSVNTIDFDGLTERPMEFSYNAIASATKSFSSLLGEGGFGSVYKGAFTQAKSRGGAELQIAVKVLEVKSKHSKQQFLNEVATIGRIHHVNVVRLLGFCMQEGHEMLVYEYVVNRSLDRWLFVGEDKTHEQVLDWGQRYAIALGVARGLSYLHEECRHRTVHCDIKPQNILLDEEMHPKIADFGLARLMNREESKVLTFAKGTPGYMAPEFWMGGESELSTKFDVYSYGMVLLELLSGRRNFRRDAAVSSFSFPAMAFKAAMEGDLESILDSRLSRRTNTSDGDEGEKQAAQWQQIKTAAFVALWCIQDHPTTRPCMSEVVKYLEGGAAVSEFPPQPNISSFSATPSTPSPSENDVTPLIIGR